MKISLNWLKDYVALEASTAEIGHAITFLGFEVEGVSTAGAPRLDQVVVGEILERAKHPSADRLSVCRVDTGPAGGVKTIVCGAQNYKVGDRVPVALPGAVLPGGVTITRSTIRGQLSDGMMCSGGEIGVGDDDDGLLILPGRPEIGLPANAVLAPQDTVFDIEVTPNRPDCLSHLGVARELAAWFGKALKYPKTHRSGDAAFPSAGALAKADRALLSEVRVDDTNDCPLYSAYCISGVKIAPSPAWLQDRLRSAGLRPINNVVDVGNFVMLEYGQPLHMFDARTLRGGQIIVRRAADGEKITTLDGEERTLNSRILVIADGERPVVIAGILGGKDAGIASDTTDLVMECAVFRPGSIRWTSRVLGASSDSSYRYERGVDPHMAGEAARRAIHLVLETAGGRVAAPPMISGGGAPWHCEIELAPEFVRERIGFDIPDKDMKASLEALDLKVVRSATSRSGGPLWTVSIPSWRADLERPIDLVEEILRLHGTDRIPATVPMSPGLAAEDDPVVRFNRRAAEYLVGHDFHECATNTLRAESEVALWVSKAAAQELALSNPFVADQSHLRPTLITGLIEALKLNQSRGVPASRLAEVGRVFMEVNGENLECAAAGFIIADDTVRRWMRREPADFYAAKHHVAALAALAGVQLPEDAAGLPLGAYFGWQEGHAAAAGDISQGWAARYGLLNLSMLKSIGIEGRVHAGIFAILPERLSQAVRRPMASLGVFPAALRDLAVVVPEDIPAASIRTQIEKIGRASTGTAFGLESVEVFDVYRGEGLPQGMKSLAFSLVFRSPERTLTDAEVNAVFQGLQDRWAKETGFAIRR